MQRDGVAVKARPLNIYRAPRYRRTGVVLEQAVRHVEFDTWHGIHRPLRAQDLHLLELSPRPSPQHRTRRVEFLLLATQIGLFPLASIVELGERRLRKRI